MVKKINTLVDDIYEFLSNDKVVIHESHVDKFTHRLVEVMRNQLSRGKQGFTLRMSNMGKPCKRQLWYEKWRPEKAAPLPPWAYMKFLYGNVLEELLLFLAEVTGHKVEGTQDEQEVEGVKGHRDAVIDGHLVDVKSANSRAFKKFRYHEVPKEDAFGYMDQLGLYNKAGRDDPLVTDKDHASFFAVDKELGHLHLDTYKFDDKDWSPEVQHTRALLDNDVPPERAFAAVPDGKSGNMQLDLPCRYCPFKKECWPGLRTFLYANGPRHLTRVVRQPNVPEVETVHG